MSTGRELSDRLDGARARGFVGRDAELTAFADSLTGASDTRLHVVYGPGGIGKSTLLDAMARLATRHGSRAVYLDARDVPCSAESVAEAIAHRSTRTATDTGTAARDVLLIDGFERLEPLDRWFRTEFLPARPATSVTVLAGRNPPSPHWWLEVGWRGLVAVHELSGLDEPHSFELLAHLGVGADRRELMAALGRGHPLVLAMLAEAARRGPVPAGLDDVPNVVAALCAMIVDDVPDAAHRSGLATCAHAIRMTEDLLRRTIGARAAEVWDWLASRPYVRRGSVGLFLHDVVRELFEAEFKHRSPDTYLALHLAVRGYFLERLIDRGEPNPDRAAAEILLLHRRGPLSAQVAELRAGGLPAITHAGPEDHSGILALIENGEGPREAQIARRWFAEQPDSLYRVRSDAGVEGFSVHVYLPTPTGLEAEDPVAAAVLRSVAEHGGLRPGERINVNRFAGATGRYQRDPTQLLCNGVACILEWSHQPTAWTFICTFDADYYGPYFEYLGMLPMFSVPHPAGAVVGYGWDRRRFPVEFLFEMMARRELSGETGPPPPDLLRPPPLSKDAFAGAVRSALGQLAQPDRLIGSPLRHSALIHPAAPDPATALASALTDAIAAVTAEPRGSEHGRVLTRTYLKGAPSQEGAAELLGLPFSTYRRHLAKALDRLIEVLWSVELGQRRLGDPATVDESD